MKILQLLNEIFLLFSFGKTILWSKTFEYCWKNSCVGWGRKSCFSSIISVYIAELIHLLLYFLPGFPRENKYKLRTSILYHHFISILHLSSQMDLFSFISFLSFKLESVKFSISAKIANESTGKILLNISVLSDSLWKNTESMIYHPRTFTISQQKTEKLKHKTQENITNFSFYRKWNYLEDIKNTYLTRVLEEKKK